MTRQRVALVAGVRVQRLQIGDIVVCLLVYL